MTVQPAALTIRHARPDECVDLTELAVRSKAWWGYSESFMRACRDELTLSVQDTEDCVVVCVGGQVAGFHRLTPVERSGASPGRGELAMLFTDPDFIGSGVGRVLFEDARVRAAQRGWSHLLIESDPHAVGFYTRLGAVQVGERLSGSIPGRSLPLLEVALPRGGRALGVHATFYR